MEEKQDLIKTITQQLMRVIKKQGRIEEIPVCLEEGIMVTPTESHTIQAIGENEDINITALAALFGVTKSAASQTVNKLVKKGYAEKKVSATSAKELHPVLTPLGRRAFQAHQRCHRRHMEAIIQRLGAFPLAQVATVSVFLDVIEDVMNERLNNE